MPATRAGTGREWQECLTLALREQYAVSEDKAQSLVQAWLERINRQPQLPMLRKVHRKMMVLGPLGDRQAAIHLLPGKVIEVLGPAENERFVRIQVDGEEFEAFEADVEERCQNFKRGGAASS